MRYIVFAYDDYCPRGGRDDVQASANSADKAREYALDLLGKFDNVEILDTLTMADVPLIPTTEA